MSLHVRWDKNKFQKLDCSIPQLKAICAYFLFQSLSKIFSKIFVYAAAAKSLQSCPTLCNPIDGSPPGSPVSGILQARTLEWVAISFSNAWKWKVKVKSLSRGWPSVTPWTAAFQAPPSMGFFQARVLEWVAVAFSGFLYMRAAKWLTQVHIIN